MPLGMLGKYERLDVLGHGASGIVYLAKDTLLGKQIALKEIAAQGEEKQKFLAEARVLDRLRHPNIVEVLGVDEIAGKVVIAMEYVRGRNLQEILRETPQLPVPEAVSLAAQICDGLAYAHSQRTVHRDVKPANVLVSHSGTVKLVDFGLAEVLGTNSFAGGAGTYAYMAPEDFHEFEQSDAQSDIWAVGVILYEMLAGRRPFSVTKAKDPFAWKRAIEGEPLVPVTEFRPDAPPELNPILARALARDKIDRYADASQMADALREVCSAPIPAFGHPSPALQERGQLQVSSASNLANSKLSAPLLQSGGGVAEGRDGGRLTLLTLADIDAFLERAPDQWEDAETALTNGTLTAWLTEIGEVPLAEVAEQIRTLPDRTNDDKLRDFLYRAGLETTQVAQRNFQEGSRLAQAGQFDAAVIPLRRAARLNPGLPQYHQTLASALRAAGDTAAAARAVENGLTHHPKQRTLARERDALSGPQIAVSASEVNFGVLRHGQRRAAKIVIRNAGSGELTGRVAAMPGWMRAEPSAFTTHRQQPLTLTAQTDGLPSEPGAYHETVALETSAGRQEIAVHLSVLPARLGLSRIGHWFLPLLLVCLFPALVGAAAPTLHDLHAHQMFIRHLWRAGFAASGLLCGGLFVLATAANTTRRLRLLTLLLLVGGVFSAGVPGELGNDIRPAVLQTSAPVFALLVLQSLAVAFDPRGWGRWQLWRWIVAATALLVSYGLWQMG